MNEKKIAGVSYDEFVKKPTTKPAPEYEEIKYENKVIAFLDILGISKLINENRDGNEHKAINKIENIRKIVESSTHIVQKSEGNLIYLQLSDSFVFVCEPKSITFLIELLATIQARIINECQFLLRGAITIGDTIIREDGKFIIGPAYIQAYQLQERDAIYPRIIVDNSVMNEIKKNHNPINKFFRQDSDKEYFIDYIKVYMETESLNKQDMIVTLSREKIFTYLNKSFTDYYKEEKHSISQKYGWTIQYFKKIEVWKNE